RLYCSDDWEPIELSTRMRAHTNPLDGFTVTRFRVGDDIIQRMSAEIFGGDSSVDPIATEVSDGLLEDIRGTVFARVNTGRTLEMRRRVKPIASLPARSFVTGGTTDGLHFDALQPRTVFRVGINLGESPRFVICGLSSLRLLYEMLGADVPDVSVTHAAKYDYARLADAPIRIIRFTVPRGYGWLMQTERVLHDGRRADPNMPSRFVLMEAEIES